MKLTDCLKRGYSVQVTNEREFVVDDCPYNFKRGYSCDLALYHEAQKVFECSSNYFWRIIWERHREAFDMRKKANKVFSLYDRRVMR